MRKIAAELLAEGTSNPGSLPWALAVREVADEPPPTHLLLRGRAATPGPEVEPRFPAVLVPDDRAAMPPPPAGAPGPSSGRRRVLADWIASGENPLTARVLVNRVWHHHFGRGLVATPNDFGSTGIAPTHPELLDWLAAEFTEGGWSLKALHRAILTSRTWRQSSRATNAAALEIDPQNDLLWRQRPRRLEAEALRDALFAVSSSLNPERGGRGFFPAISREALAGMSRPGLGWEPSSSAERARRSVYAFSMRGLQVPFFQTFDAPPSSLSIGSRPTTTLATQALTLLNSDLAARSATSLARRVAAEAGAQARARVQRAFERALAREPDEEEVRLALEFLDGQRAGFARAPEELVFRPRVPERLEVRYHEHLQAEDFLYGPRDGWSYGAGVWGGGYNGTLEWSLRDGPFALAERAAFPDGAPFRLAGVVTVEPDTEATLLLRAAEEEGRLRAIEVELGAEGGTVEVRVARGGERRSLGVATDAFEAGAPFTLAIETSADELRVAIEEHPVLAVPLPDTEGGVLGVRVRGEAVYLRALELTTAEGSHSLAASAVPADLRALASLCLVLLNHNEFVYVD